MAMHFLKKASQLMPTQDIRYLLHQHLTGYDKGRPLSRIHASEVTKPDGFCPRYYALADVTKFKTPDEWLSTSEQVTFQMGRDLERNIVLWFADMDRAVCHWKCQSCGTVHEFTKRPHKCKECGSRALLPQEVRFESQLCGASCGIDMLVSLNSGGLRPVEIKTMDKDEFKALQAPLAEHKLRTTLYLRLIAESGHPWAKLINTDEADILYTSKGGYGCAAPDLAKLGLPDKFSPFKKFVIKRDDKLVQSVWELSKVAHDFRAGNVEMPCGVCSTALSKRASLCKLKKACFSGEYPAKYDWTV